MTQYSILAIHFHDMQIVFGASLPCTAYQGTGNKLVACATSIAVRSDKIDYEFAKLYGKIAMSVTPGRSMLYVYR